MIQITCTQCKTVLTIDEAFAGGVCRCRHCGTIQTVPKHLKDQAGSNDGGGGSGGIATQVAGTKTAQQKTLYQKKHVTGDGGGSSGTGLDDLANIVSSGLSSSRLQNRTGGSSGMPDSAGGKSRKKETPPNRKTALIASIGGAAVLLIGLIVFMATRGKDPENDPGKVAVAQSTGGGKISPPVQDQGPAKGNTTGGGSALSFKKIPSFVGQGIGEKSVAYVIDCGQASRLEGKFDLLRLAVGRSLQSLGEGKKFQVVFWSQEGKVLAFPKDNPTSASSKAVADCIKWMANIESGGLTMVSPALEKAFKGKPEAVILVAVKADLDDNFAPAVLKKRSEGKSNARYYTFSINQPELAGPLKKIAGDTKGAYRDLSIEDLRSGG